MPNHFHFLLRQDSNLSIGDAILINDEAYLIHPGGG